MEAKQYAESQVRSLQELKQEKQYLLNTAWGNQSVGIESIVAIARDIHAIDLAMSHYDTWKATN